jgi:uncharacterized protein YjaZ
MGIIHTDSWLKADFDRPLNICAKLIPHFKKQKENEIYHQLQQFGMYRPSRLTKHHYQFMIEKKIWERVEKLFQHYKKLWSGPDIPIFLFPIAQTGGFFFRQESSKSGVSYPDKMFLFIGELDDLKELEAIFVHEYHHVCRLQQSKKQMDEMTLLDSIIIEGLAEYAVLQHCGPDYLAKWCRMYSDKDLEVLWNRHIKDQLTKRKQERGHDDLLYGGGRVPKLLGYAAGFAIVEKYYQDNRYTAKLSFTVPAQKFIENKNIFSTKSP